MRPTPTLAMDLGDPHTTPAGPQAAIPAVSPAGPQAAIPAVSPGESPDALTLVRKIDLAHALGVNKSTITKAAQAGRLVPAADPTLAAQGWYDRDASLARFRATRGGRPDLVELHAAKRRGAAGRAGPAGQAGLARPSGASPGSAGPADADAVSGPARLADADAATGPSWPADATATARPARPAVTSGAGAAAAGPALAAIPSHADSVSGQDRAQVKGQILATENAITKLEIALARGQRLPLTEVGRESHAWGQRLADHLLRVIDQIAARLAAVPDPAERQRLLRPELRRVRRAFDQAGIASLRALKASGRGRLRREERP